jgi:hypothetical protein
MQRGLWMSVLAGLLAVVGCTSPTGDDGLFPVSGTIKLDGTPTANVSVVFIPQGNTAGHGGSGVTDASGQYQLMSPQGKKGLPPGEYKVAVSRRLNPDGSPPAPNEMPIESQARETLPLKYSDKEKTELVARLTADDKKTFDFDLKTKSK